MASSLEKILRNFFWEVFSGSKINHLVSWIKVTPSQIDGDLGLGGTISQNMTPCEMRLEILEGRYIFMEASY